MTHTIGLHQSVQTLTMTTLLSQTDGVANQIQATSDGTPTHDVTEDVLLPVEHGSTSTQYTGDNVKS